MPLHVSSTCAHHQEVKIALHNLWYHHTYRWPSRAQVERGPVGMHSNRSSLKTDQAQKVFGVLAFHCTVMRLLLNAISAGRSIKILHVRIKDFIISAPSTKTKVGAVLVGTCHSIRCRSAVIPVRSGGGGPPKS